MAGRILVVDDHATSRMKLRMAVKALGHVAVAAVDGASALDLLRQSRFDLVLLDVLMPGMSGFDVLESIKSDPQLRDIPVVVISALEEMEGVVRAIEKGAEDFLPKPYDPVLLKARVGACLEKKRLHDVELEHLRQIELERQRADALLHVILPPPAVMELKATDRVAPRRHEAVTVIFADVVDFTSYCDRCPPEEVVANLQLLVESFEELATAHGLEKIKTAGDAFMAAAGLNAPIEDPVMASLRCAFSMVAAARRTPPAWQLRIGIHRGPVVAGVVGRHKFSYDLWGDTINVAARLSELGGAGSINLSGQAWSSVGGRCLTTPLGPVLLKGKGSIDVFNCIGIEEENALAL
jgi:class 3 adenylate cyclase